MRKKHEEGNRREEEKVEKKQQSSCPPPLCFCRRLEYKSKWITRLPEIRQIKWTKMPGSHTLGTIRGSSISESPSCSTIQVIACSMLSVPVA